VVTRLLERLPRWQLALISMAAGAGLFAGGMWIFNREQHDSYVEKAARDTIRDMNKNKAIEVCRLESMRYGKDKYVNDQIKYVEQCMIVEGFRPILPEGYDCDNTDTGRSIMDSKCYE
jgi:hypothetical protein